MSLEKEEISSLSNKYTINSFNIKVISESNNLK